MVRYRKSVKKLTEVSKYDNLSVGNYPVGTHVFYKGHSFQVEFYYDKNGKMASKELVDVVSVSVKAKLAALVKLMGDRRIAIIEDNIHGELYFGGKRPTTLKSMDRKGLVLHCASFSKTLSPGLRVRWTLPGRFADRVKRLKMNSTIASPTLNQQVVAQFLKTGAFDRHLRSLRTALKNQISNTGLAIARHFPQGTRITAPQGGLTLWVELDKRVDGLRVFQEARRRKISIFPGIICSTTGRYRNFIRISCGYPWNDTIENGIVTLANIIKRML